MYVLTDDSERIQVCYDRCAPPEAIEVTEPDNWDWSRIFDWVLQDGVLVYDPLPTEPAPEPDLAPDYDSAIVELASLIDLALTRMDEQDAALVELASIITEGGI